MSPTPGVRGRVLLGHSLARHCCAKHGCDLLHPHRRHQCGGYLPPALISVCPSQQGWDGLGGGARFSFSLSGSTASLSLASMFQVAAGARSRQNTGRWRRVNVTEADTNAKERHGCPEQLCSQQAVIKGEGCGPPTQRGSHLCFFDERQVLSFRSLHNWKAGIHKSQPTPALHCCLLPCRASPHPGFFTSSAPSCIHVLLWWRWPSVQFSPLWESPLVQK